MTTPRPIVVSEVLDYFGKCPRCEYAATAVRATRVRADGSFETVVVATCGLPCGWRGPVPLTRMTNQPPPERPRSTVR